MPERRTTPEPHFEAPFTIEIDGEVSQSGIRSHDRAIEMMQPVANANPGRRVEIFDRHHRQAGEACLRQGRDG
jgi:hypothetical protein